MYCALSLITAMIFDDTRWCTMMDGTAFGRSTVHVSSSLSFLSVLWNGRIGLVYEESRGRRIHMYWGPCLSEATHHGTLVYFGSYECENVNSSFCVDVFTARDCLVCLLLCHTILRAPKHYGSKNAHLGCGIQVIQRD
jgi:hypothetical protein